MGIGLRTLIFHLWKHIAPTFKWSTKIKQYKNFKYLGSVLTEHVMCDSEIERRIRVVKGTFQKFSKVKRNRIILLETRKRVLKYLCNVCLSLWEYILDTVFTDEEKVLEATEMWLHIGIKCMSCTEQGSNHEVLEKTETWSISKRNIRKIYLKFWGHIVRKQRLKYLTLKDVLKAKVAECNAHRIELINGR